MLKIGYLSNKKAKKEIERTKVYAIGEASNVVRVGVYNKSTKKTSEQVRLLPPSIRRNKGGNYVFEDRRFAYRCTSHKKF